MENKDPGYVYMLTNPSFNVKTLWEIRLEREKY